MVANWMIAPTHAPMYDNAPVREQESGKKQATIEYIFRGECHVP